MVDWKAMATEPVTVEYMGVGGAPSSVSRGSEERVSLVRPISTIPNNGGGDFRESPVPEGGRDNRPFTQHDLQQTSWNRTASNARFQSEEDNSRRVIICPKGYQFGSPMPISGQKLGGVGSGAFVAEKKPPFQHPFQGGDISRPGGACLQPRAAQLTIFYAGMVNVYDDVPVDKAQAIMLLAGSGNTWSSNIMNPPQGGSAAYGRTFSALTTLPLSKPESPAPQASTTSAAGPLRSVLSGVVFSNVRQTPTTNAVELPQARKASLARFLEKRKDRVKKVLVKEGDATPSFDNSVSPSVEKQPKRSPSPSPSVPRCMVHGLSPDRLEHQSGPSSDSEQNSPCNPKPPQTPTGQCVSEERSGNTSKRSSSRMDNESNKRTRSGKSTCRAIGGSFADHAVDNGSSPHK